VFTAHIRDGHSWTHPVTIGELAVDDEEAPRPPGEDRTDAGLTLQDITSTLRARLRLPPGIAGVVVASVASDSPADRAGVERGDIITAIDKRAIQSATDARAALGGADAGQPIFILLRRGGAERFLLMRKE
jgi:serine protease Do